MLDDPERLMRVNSQWVFEKWEWLAADRFRFSIRNLSIGRHWATEGKVLRKPDGIRLEYQDGIKTSTHLHVEETASGSRLWVTDDYSRLPEVVRKQRLDDVDRTLTRWGEDLHRYLAAWARWSHIRLWRWYMERVWRRSTPLGRRVIRLLILVTAVEFIVFLMLLMVLAIEI